MGCLALAAATGSAPVHCHLSLPVQRIWNKSQAASATRNSTICQACQACGQPAASHKFRSYGGFGTYVGLGPKPHKPNHWTFECEPGFTLASDEMPESFKLEVQARIFAAIDLMLPPPDRRIEAACESQAQPH